MQVRVYEFNGTSLALFASFAHGATIFSVDFSPVGLFLAIGGATATGPVQIRVLSAIIFAQNCTIMGNQISNINGGAVPAPGSARGRGISATAGSNLIIQNTAFDCDISYEFVTNVFRQFLVNVIDLMRNKKT